MKRLRIVFDAKSWNKVGHDISDNSCFWKPALVGEPYLDKEGREIADVSFLDNPTEVSHGHFTEFMRKP